LVFVRGGSLYIFEVIFEFGEKRCFSTLSLPLRTVRQPRVGQILKPLPGQRMKPFADQGACPEIRLLKDLDLRWGPRTELAPSCLLDHKHEFWQAAESHGSRDNIVSPCRLLVFWCRSPRGLEHYPHTSHSQGCMISHNARSMCQVSVVQ